MASYKKILELYCSGINISQISERVGRDRATVRRVISKSEGKGILPSQWKELDETQLRGMLRKSTKVKPEYFPINFEWMYDELSNAHVTVNLLHEEYEEQAKKEGLRPYSRSQFFERYKKWCNVTKYSAKIKNKPGHSMELDFAGDLVQYIDPLTKTAVKVPLFVSTLSFSKLLWVQAVPRQTAVCFAHSVVDAFKFFKGVTRAIIVDNTKSAVILHSKHELAVLSELFRELGEHYGATVIAAPARTPKFKPTVEDGVSNTYTRILAPLRHCIFYSLEELNEALALRCEVFNNEPFKEKESWSRRSLFEAEEQQMLSQLPSTNFEVREKATATVRENCHAKCSLDGYYYSVPYLWCKKRVILRLGSVDVRILSLEGQFICSHPRGIDPWHRYVTDPAHMPSYIRQYVYASPSLFCEQAERIGPATLEVIGRLFSIAEANARVVEVEYDTARGILSLERPTKRNPGRSSRTLEMACKELISLHPSVFTRISYNAVRNTVQQLIDEEARMRADKFIAEKLCVGNIMDILQEEVEMAYTIEQIRLERDEKILQAFKRLRLPGMAGHFREILDGTVVVEGQDISSILEQFIDAELLRRTGNKAEKLIREARLWYPSADLEEVSSNTPYLSAQLISTLSKVRFIDAGAFLIIHGGPKSGTTYLGCAIGASACRLSRRTRYIRYFDLLSRLIDAKRTGGLLQEELEELRTIPCLIVDDWMNSPMSQNELMLMREIMDYRPKNGGTILVSHSHPDLWRDLMETTTSYRDSMFHTLTEGAMIIELN